MRALRVMLILFVLFPALERTPLSLVASAAADDRGRAPATVVDTAPSQSGATSSGTAKGADLVYAPKAGSRDETESSGVGTFLVVAAVVVFGVIVGFMIRYHRSGRAG